MLSVDLCCDLNETWENCLDEFRGVLKDSDSVWRCYTCDGVNKESMLSAPEVMDAKTDPGFGYGEVYSINKLLSSGEIPSAATLDGDALLDVMDFIHMKELSFLQGFSLTAGCLSFPYFFKLDLLKEQNPTLYAYCRGLSCSFMQVLIATTLTNIPSEEEVALRPRSFDCCETVPVEEILHDLEVCAARAASPAIAARLRWRQLFLSALHLFLTGTRRADTVAACAMCAEALALLDTPAFARDAEPRPSARLFWDASAVYWAGGITPAKPIAPPPFAETITAYRELLRQLAAAQDLYELDALQSVLEYVEALGARQPLLLVREVIAMVLFRGGPLEAFLHGPSLPHRVLAELASEHGAPLYRALIDGDEDLLEGVVKYRMHRTMEPLKVTPAQMQALRQRTLESVQQWAVEVSKTYLLYMEAMLCNRGLAHRRLMNLMPHLGALQEVSYTTDTAVFLSLVPSVPAELEAEAQRRSPALAIFANQHVLRVMRSFVSLTIELDLVTRAEVMAALWYLNFTERAQMENLAMLSLPPGIGFPETRMNRRTKVPLYNLTITTRREGRGDGVRRTLLETARVIGDAVYVSACVMEAKGLIDLTSGAKHAMISVENVFNHRMKCLQHIRSPPFTPYAHCMASKPELDAPKIALYAQKAGEIALGAAERLKQLLTSKELDALRKKSIQSHVEAMEKTARVVSASLAHFASICENEEALGKCTARIERPFDPSMICFTMHKKES